jgi:hypothetical protein
LHSTSLSKWNPGRYHVLSLIQSLNSLWILCKLLARFHLLIECNLKCNIINFRNS